MVNSIKSICLDELIGHPGNPNKMSDANFRKLVRNIERSGRYEPIVVRPHPEREGVFQIINGHHRCKALAKLGYESADCVIWDVDDEQTDILLATLNRLGGLDELSRKVKLLKKLSEKMQAGELSKLVPHTARQLERLMRLKRPSEPIKIKASSFASPLVFFLTDEQKNIVEKALSLAQSDKGKKNRAAKKAEGLVNVSQHYIKNSSALVSTAQFYLENQRF